MQNRPDRIPEPKPETARQAVALARDDHRWKNAPLDTTSTDGIQRNIDALWATVERLAQYIDGDVEPKTNGERASDYPRTPDPALQPPPVRPSV